MGQIGTPRVGTVAYGTTSVVVTVPTVEPGEQLLLCAGAKPLTANGLSWSSPSGYTTLAQRNNAGGYGTTLAADTGNTSVAVFQKVAAGTEDGSTVTVTPGGSGSDCCWGVFVVFGKSGGTWNLGSATGTDTSTADGMSVAMGTDPGISASDYLLGLFCDPTNANNGANLSSPAMSCSGLTIGTVTELAEPCTSNGNNVAGYVAAAPVTAGASSGNLLTFSATAVTGTNVKGPGLVVRLRAVPGLMPFFGM